jgi:hypothetical protein
VCVCVCVCVCVTALLSLRAVQQQSCLLVTFIKSISKSAYRVGVDLCQECSAYNTHWLFAVVYVYSV